jgi:eukaryotic-like serine/threonine-protein kinase
MNGREIPPERWRRISELLDEALELPAEARGAFLDGACGEDSDLRRRLGDLLAASERSWGFLDRPALTHAASLLREAAALRNEGALRQPGEDAGADPAANDLDPRSTLTSFSSLDTATQIGSYRLLEKLGEGGMGEVWLAEQSEPVRRRVALKLLKAGMDTQQVIARFEAERQALALMDHPCIAKVFDAGQTPRGLPFFVMEHVAGERITAHCDGAKLTTRERLELFLQVCEGVQHAHQKGIIHRDLKPSNVLVALAGDKPLPKIIDFGVAKATAQPLTERTLYTELGVMIGTPEYMSPEQTGTAGADVDTRTDVYALGVLLYELLTGALPFDPKELRRASLEEIRRRIREVEPPKPSTRLRTLGERSEEVARNRSTDRGKLVSRLRGDLDWIVMKALEKDRVRRYGSPSELAADIRRHLEHQPVLASPPSAIYRAGKFVRRHRFGVSVAGVAIVVLAVFAATIVRERDRAKASARESQRVTEFLTGMLEAAGPQRIVFSLGLAGSTDPDIKVRDMLDRAAKDVEARFAGDPAVLARIRDTIGETYQAIGLYDRAEPQLRAAVALREGLGDREALLKSLHELGQVLSHRGDNLSALEVAKRVTALGRELYGPESLRYTQVLSSQAAYLNGLGRNKEAESLLEEAQRIITHTSHPEPDWEKFELEVLNDLAAVRQELGAPPADVEALNRQVVDLARRFYGEANLGTLTLMHNLATTLYAEKKYAEAETVYREVLASRRGLYGSENLEVALTLNSLGMAVRNEGRLEEAEPMLREALSIRKKLLGPDHRDVQVTESALANLLTMRGSCVEAEGMHRGALEARQRATIVEPKLVASSLQGLAESLACQKRFSEAEPLFKEALAIRLGAQPAGHPDVAKARESLAKFYETWSKPDRAAAVRAGR